MVKHMTPPPIILSQPKTVKYSLNRGDILRWQLYALMRNRTLIFFGLFLSLFLAWNDLRAPDLASRLIGFKILFALFLTIMMFCAVGLGTMSLMACMITFRRYKGLLGHHELEIRDEGLVERTDVNESLHRWSGFHKIASTGRYLFIYVTDNNVHVVPRRYFASKGEQQAFRDELERRIKGK
jgi:hypothetical protein